MVTGTQRLLTFTFILPATSSNSKSQAAGRKNDPAEPPTLFRANATGSVGG